MQPLSKREAQELSEFRYLQDGQRRRTKVWIEGITGYKKPRQLMIFENKKGHIKLVDEVSSEQYTRMYDRYGTHLMKDGVCVFNGWRLWKDCPSPSDIKEAPWAQISVEDWRNGDPDD